MMVAEELVEFEDDAVRKCRKQLMVVVIEERLQGLAVWVMAAEELVELECGAGRKCWKQMMVVEMEEVLQSLAGQEIAAEIACETVEDCYKIG